MVLGKIRSLAKSRRGNVIAIAAAALPVVVGSAGLATDTVQWTLWKRQLQRQADSAALAGAFALSQGQLAATSVNDDIARTAEVPLSATPVIETPPTVGAGAGNASAVRVALQTQRNLAFSSLFITTAPTISAQSTAALVNNGDYCVIALESTSTTGISMGGNSSVNMGCGMATNSKGSTAVYAGGSSQIWATPVAAVGNVPASSAYQGDTELKSHQVAQRDPFARLPDPTSDKFTGCKNMSVQPNKSADFGPGCYKNVDIKGTANLSAGTYYIDGGTFSVGSQGVLNGMDGVTIVLTSSKADSMPSDIATVDMNGGAQIRLTAPKSGDYAGVIFYQDRRAVNGGKSDNKINGNSSAFYEGAIYFPQQQVTFTGTTGMNTNCLQLVARRVAFNGNSSITNNCPVDSGAHSFKGTVVRLIG